MNKDLVIFERRLFKQAILKLKSLNINTSPEPSYLRVEQSLSNSKSKYDFNIKVESGTTATERKLDTNDLFICTRIGIFLAKVDDDELGREVLCSYPDRRIFTDNSGFDAQDLMVLYNGELSLKFGQKVNAEAIPGWNFFNVPQTQKASTSGYAQFDIQDACYWPGSIFYLKGNASIEITYQLKQNYSYQIACTNSGFTNKLVLMPMGYLVKGAASKIAKEI